MYGHQGFSGGHLAAAAAVMLVLALTLGVVGALPARAADSAITGQVIDSASALQPGIVVDVLNAGSLNIVTNTTIDAQGAFAVSVSPGTYDLRFTPPASSGLQTYLATGIATDSTPLTVVLKPIVVIHLTGTKDTKGNLYPKAGALYMRRTWLTSS